MLPRGRHGGWLWEEERFGRSLRICDIYQPGIQFRMERSHHEKATSVTGSTYSPGQKDLLDDVGVAGLRRVALKQFSWMGDLDEHV